MRRPKSPRAWAFPLSVTVIVASFVGWWFPEIAIHACREASLLCGCTAAGAARALAAEPPAVRMRARMVDDAGRACCADEIQIVELRVETDVSRYVGHAYLKTPTRAVGFYTDVTDLGLSDYVSPLASPVRGTLRDDAGRRYDRVRHYRVSPETLRVLEESIREHAGQAYQVGNWGGGRNCATWATERLRDAGLSAPQGDRPNKLAPQMEQVNEWADENGTSRRTQAATPLAGRAGG